MNKTTLFLIVILTGLCILTGYNYFYQPFKAAPATKSQASPSPAPAQTSVSTVDDLDVILSNMSSRQKVALLIAAPYVLEEEIAETPVGTSAAVPTSALPTPAPLSQRVDLNWLETIQPGGVTIFGKNISQAVAANFTAQLRVLPSRPLVLVDHEGGTTQRLNGQGFTALPSWQSACAQTESVLANQLTQSAQELSAVGVDVVLAPVVDFAAQHPTLRSRICAADPELVVARAKQFIQIFQNAQIMPVLKHFPGIGQTKRDLHVAFDRVTIGPEEAGIYADLLKEFPLLGVMVTHVGVTNQFADKACSLSDTCLRELKVNAPQAYVMSDALEMKSALLQAQTTPQPLSRVAIQAIDAGNELLIFGPGVTQSELEEVINLLQAEYDGNEGFRIAVEPALKKNIYMRQKKGYIQ